jgi:hypothetical protein
MPLYKPQQYLTAGQLYEINQFGWKAKRAPMEINMVSAASGPLVCGMWCVYFFSHGSSNDAISCRARLQRPEISLFLLK